MASIASVYIDVLPTTGKIADGIAKALRSADDAVIKAARRWKKDIDRELLGNAEVDVSADTAQAKKDIKEVEKSRYTAKVKVDVDQASLAKTRALGGGGGGGRLGSGLGALGGAAKLEGSIAGISLAPNLVTGLGSVVSAVGQLSGVLGPVSVRASDTN